MRSILCFGDSNTHGQIPGMGPLDRYAREQRWPGILQAQLGAGWHVIEEGLSGRTTVHDDPIEGAHKNGRLYLRPCLQSHAPLDLVILMLGTNDLKVRFHMPPSEVAMGIGCLVYDIKELAPGPRGAVRWLAGSDRIGHVWKCGVAAMRTIASVSRTVRRCIRESTSRTLLANTLSSTSVSRGLSHEPHTEGCEATP